MISAEMILDSVDPSGDHRMRTFKLRYPWFIHGELMTHRMLSKNASSNRAIPLSKMLEEARSDELRAEPVIWGAEQKGMSPGAPLSPEETFDARMVWRGAAFAAASFAEHLSVKSRVHKSLCNRLLMPFTHANAVISGTEWDNFFGLRLDKAADPTMRALAEAMWRAQGESTPNTLQPGQWHLPFVDLATIKEQLFGDASDAEIRAVCDGWPNVALYLDNENPLIKVSVARCARVSYESFETGRRSTIEEDLKLYERLVGAQPLHASPDEHQATPMPAGPAFNIYDRDWEVAKKQQGNLVGWRQYRKMLPGEAVAPLPAEYRDDVEEAETCPNCGNRSVVSAPGGGVKCTTPRCEYWFCF